MVTLVRNSCLTDLEGDISFIKSFILSCFNWVIPSYANKESKGKKGCAVHFYSQTTMNHFWTKKERLRLTDLDPRPQGLIGGIGNFAGFFKIVPLVSIYFQYIIWYFASALVLNVRYMFYTDKCHLVRTTNIAKFNRTTKSLTPILLLNMDFLNWKILKPEIINRIKIQTSQW